MTSRHRLALAHERRLAMTFAMQKALAILQMPQIELSQWIQQEIEKNPLLEEISSPMKKQPIFSEIPTSESLYELLTRQIREHFTDKKTLSIAEKMLEFLDEKGFLSAPIEEIALTSNASISQIETILTVLQTFEPLGIFARSLQEALLIQLKEKGLALSDTYYLVQNYFNDFIHSRYSAIKKKSGSFDFKQAIQILSQLNLRPSSIFKEHPISIAIADLNIDQTERGWIVKINEEELPQFQIQHTSIKLSSSEEEIVFQEWLRSAKWLQRSLSRRRQILLQIGMYITRYQSAFLSQKGNLKELTIQDLSSHLQLHESTLSRAISGKYVETPLGLLPLRSLLNTSEKTEEAKSTLCKLIDQENKAKPLTDDQLVLELQKKGCFVARRTIAKYRKELKIGTASARKYNT